MSCGMPTTAASVTGDVDDIVHASGDPIIAVRIATRAVTGEVHSLKRLEVRIDEALMVTVYGAHLARPAIEKNQYALASAVKDAALVVDDCRLHAEERHGRRTRLQGDRARQRRDQNSAGLRLPPGIDNRAAAIAHDTGIPFPGLRIDRLSHGTEQAQRLSRTRFHRPLAFAHQRPNRGGR